MCSTSEPIDEFFEAGGDGNMKRTGAPVSTAQGENMGMAGLS